MAKKDINKKSSFDLLKPAHQIFVKNYLLCFGNSTKAYRMAYPRTSYDSAAASASRLLKNNNIANAIKEAYANIWIDKDSEIEKSKTYLLLHAITNSNIFDVVEIKDGELILKDMNNIPLQAHHAIESISYVNKKNKYGFNKKIEIKMYPKIPALLLRAKIQGLLDRKNDGEGRYEVIPMKIPPEIRKKNEVKKKVNRKGKAKGAASQDGKKN